MTEPAGERFLVVVNDEDQYSVWPEVSAVPAGWRTDGFAGTKDECLDHIAGVWTDMRPRSVRLHMEGTRADRRPPGHAEA